MVIGRRSVLAAACAAALASAAPAFATTGTVTVSQTQAGVTPLYIGYNQGHYRTGGDTSAWLDYSGVNAFRVWAAPGDYSPSSAATSGDSITDLAGFETKKAAVSTGNPETNGVIPLSQYLAKFPNTQSGRNSVNLNTLLADLKDRNITPVMQITRALPKGETGAVWSDNWEQWQHFYAMAYLCARDYGVVRYQTYNEPDQSTASAQRTPAEWVAGMKLAADAVRSAIADVNRIYGKRYVADISGPTKIGGADSTSTWTPGSGFSDYGEAALESNRTDYAGRAVNYDIFNTYDLHRYNDSTIGNAFITDQQTLATKIPQYNASGQNLPVTYTEYNRQNSSSFNGSSNTLDTPSVFTELATTNLRAMSQNVKGLYAFKFNQTLWDPDNNNATPEVPQKTGFYYLVGTGTDTTGATKGAGVQKLFAKGFKGERPRQVVTSTGSVSFDVATSFDAGSKNFYVMGVNRSSSATHQFTLDLTSWDVRPGSVISVEEVSASHSADVTRFVTVPANKQVTLTQPTQSVWLLTAPSGAVQTQLNFLATDDAQVRNSTAGDPSYRTTNYGQDTTASVARSASTAAGDFATYMKFNVSSLPTDNISRAILWVTGQNITSSAAELFHVYGITDNNWNESTLTWATAPGLSSSTDAKMTGVGTSVFPVGQLTFDNTLSEWGIDITDYLRQHPSGVLSFALVREERFTNDANNNVVQIFTSESGLGPRLTVFAVPEPSLAVFSGMGVLLLLRRRRRG